MLTNHSRLTFHSITQDMPLVIALPSNTISNCMSMIFKVAPPQYISRVFILSFTLMFLFDMSQQLFLIFFDSITWSLDPMEIGLDGGMMLSLEPPLI